MRPSEPLIKTLSSAIAARRRLKELVKGRNDWDNVERSLMAGEQFLRSYPGASDQTVRAWARKNEAHIDRIFTSQTRKQQLRLLSHDPSL